MDPNFYILLFTSIHVVTLGEKEIHLIPDLCSLSGMFVMLLHSQLFTSLPPSRPPPPNQQLLHPSHFHSHFFHPPHLVHISPLPPQSGLTDEARADFGIMKDVSAHTRVSPATHHERMIRFMQDIRDKQVAQQQLNRWGLKYTPELLEVKARVLAPEKIFQQRELAPYKPAEAEWYFVYYGTLIDAR